VLTVEVDLIGLTAALQDEGRLSADGADDRAAIQYALEQLLFEWADPGDETRQHRRARSRSIFGK
jgi:hypothetical protein